MSKENGPHVAVCICLKKVHYQALKEMEAETAGVLQEAGYSTHPCRRCVRKCVWSANDCSQFKNSNILSANVWPFILYANELQMELHLPSALEQLVLNLNSLEANAFFCELRQSHGSFLGLEDVICVMAPVAQVCFWSNNHIVWNMLKSLHQPIEMIPQVTSDSSGWPWKQFCGHMWMKCHMGPESLIFPTATAGFPLRFFPAVRWDGFPPLSSTVNFWVTILPFSVT